ncbi:predicted protein [Enterococcus gallinarum EG2]|nr:predicted protein [Enterococcus gallinarum EG2]
MLVEERQLFYYYSRDCLSILFKESLFTLHQKNRESSWVECFFIPFLKLCLLKTFAGSCAGFLLIPLIRSISGVGNGDRIASPFTSRWKESLNEYNKFDCQICE